MAADYIVVDRNKQLGNQLVRAAGLLRELQELVDQLNDITGHSFTGADYSVMEARFGLVAGTGANAATLLGLIHIILNTNGEVTGSNRSAQLEEFTARLAGQ